MRKQKKIFCVIIVLFYQLKAEIATHEISIPSAQTKLIVHFNNNNNHEIKNFQDQHAHSDAISSSHS